jgi:hypothetical protein
MAAGTVWSRPPAVISSGPRVLLPVLTLAGERGTTFDLLDLLPHRRQADLQRLQGLGRDAFPLADQAQQDVLGAM